MLPRLTILVAAIALLLAVPSSASAIFIGSSLRFGVNTSFGCAFAPGFDPITGQPGLLRSNQRTCTYRNVGPIGRFNGGSLVPYTGRVVSWKVRSGSVPAPLRLTILTGGASCCTARYIGPVVRPRANRTTRFASNVRAYRTVDRSGFQATDVVGLSIVGPGTIPLRAQGTTGTFRQGSGLVQFWYPLTRIGDPRVEGSQVDGLELLFQFEYRR